MNNIETLIEILVTMDIPQFRIDGVLMGKKITHLRWLNRNLGVRNKTHQRYDEAIAILTAEIKRA